MEEVFGLHQFHQLQAVGFHDQSAAMAGGEGLQAGSIPGYVLSSCSAAVSEASVVAGGGGSAAAGASVGGGVPAAGEEAVCSTSAIKAKIASHPLYPRLLEAYIDCQKENDIKRNAVPSFLGADPELDYFMAMYCDMLVKYKLDIARPFDEATTFLNSIEVQLGNLCKGSFASVLCRLCFSFCSEEAGRSSEEEYSGEEMDARPSRMLNEDGDQLKEKLLRKYSGYLSSLKQEFSKKKKKGKLPKSARQTLLDWWHAHYKWPYPTEADKVALAEATGLNQKQINNWFINQRKRHWKPSENMQLAFMNTLSAPLYLDGQ
ncbi:hypothetical protein Taro_045790 [Colocasia esculenta]|uniref:Uncharacterized protein n=1 Tax=Colocasia esculenta TaxID=4460 RepID=A0A843X396_COLES|nr:hypothetical protein [Colocasia esculenta]